ncbi:MAG: SDR family oxidoreductase [Leptospirales bacterium]|nr:SDR family oxidoreductase [Leptospirales bacterium]
MDLKDRIVAVTGGAGGIGLAMLQRFAASGAIPAALDLTPERCDRAAHELRKLHPRAGAWTCNVASEESVTAAFQALRSNYGRIDVAVLNAGILDDGLLLRVDRTTGKVKARMSLAQWQRVIDVNLTGVFLSGREAAAIMVEEGGGVIIPIASVAMHGNAGQSNYSAAKAGVAALTRLWAQELSRFKIRVAGIAPGFVATEMVLKDMNQQALDLWKSRIPIGRLGDPQEIADAAHFIACNELVNGVVLEISGGVKI